MSLRRTSRATHGSRATVALPPAREYARRRRCAFSTEHTSRAALNLYSSTAGAFEDLASVGDLFAHQSAVAIDYAREIDNLQQAMQTRAAIGQAVGVAMERYGMSEERAFAFLTRLSQHRNLKLRDLVAEFLKTVQSPRTSASLVGNPES